MKESEKIFGNAILKDAPLDEAELNLINGFALEKLSAHDVFTFKLAVCDNDIDRDFERFTEDTLSQLAGFVAGRTVICDHTPKASNQSARIYRTELESAGQVTTDGRPLVRLVAHCYMPRTAGNADLITEISAGIKKEVSIACGIEKRVCSICGKDDGDGGRCMHRKGETYDGKLCYFELQGAKDAYEVSFVAVPAQRKAGVIKSHSPEEDQLPLDISKALEIEKAKAKAKLYI